MCLRAVLLLVLLLVCSTHLLVHAKFHETVYTARLDGNQVSPVNGDERWVGSAICVWGRMARPKYIDCQISHTIPYDATLDIFNSTQGKLTQVPERLTAFIGAAAEGRTGPGLYFFPGAPLGPTFRWSFTIEDALLDDYVYTAEQQELDFLNGNFFVQINSVELPEGNIRGQIEHHDFWYARLGSWQMIPQNNNSVNYDGTAIGRYSFHNKPMQMEAFVVHDLESASQTIFGRGAQGEIGLANIALNDAVSPINEEWTLIKRWETLMLEEKTFLEIAADTRLEVGIRAPIQPIDYPVGVGFTSRLNGLNVIPNTASSSVGCALITYDCETRLMEYFIVHNVQNVLAAAMWQGADFDDGVPLWDLSRAKSPIWGARKLSYDEELALYSEDLFFQISSKQNPQGDIRGQISTDYQWYAYMTGTQVVPPVSTPHVGCATFSFPVKGNIMDYEIVHTIPEREMLDLELWWGLPDRETELLRSFNRVVSPIIGDDEEMTPSMIEKVTKEQLYVSARTTRFQVQSEIRGQIFRLTPCFPGTNPPIPVTSSPSGSTPPTPPETGETKSASASSMRPVLLSILLSSCASLMWFLTRRS